MTASPNGPDASTRVRIARERASRRIAELRSLFDAIVASCDAANLDDEHDPEGATIGFERAQVCALLEQARAQLEALDAASDRIRSGSYGLCEHCGKPIPAARLAAQPATCTCIACAGSQRYGRLAHSRDG
jgi:RNA polymerase-binding transcription factor DksA